MSLYESISLTELPIVTFSHCGVALNFLLDTGSNWNYISKNTYELIEEDIDQIKESNSTVISPSKGTKSEIKVHTVIKYKDSLFPVEMHVCPDLNYSFKEVKDNTGVTVHGILGTKFLNKYGYILDFKNLKVYR